MSKLVRLHLGHFWEHLRETMWKFIRKPSYMRLSFPLPPDLSKQSRSELVGLWIFRSLIWNYPFYVVHLQSLLFALAFYEDVVHYRIRDLFVEWAVRVYAFLTKNCAGSWSPGRCYANRRKPVATAWWLKCPSHSFTRFEIHIGHDGHAVSTVPRVFYGTS